MSQDPWKKAYRHQRSLEGVRRQRGGRPPRRQREHSIPLVVAFIIVVPFLVGVGMIWYAWQNRGTLIPQNEEKLPELVNEKLSIPPRNADLVLLDDGMGFGLRVFGSQGEVVRYTTKAGLKWELTALGSDRSRLTTEGLVMQAQGDVIESYELDVQAVYDNPKWQDTCYQLRLANIDPQLNLREVRGDAEISPGKVVIQLTGPEVVQYSGNWRHAAYELEFRDGWLTKLRGGMAIGAATDGDTVSGGGSAVPGDG